MLPRARDGLAQIIEVAPGLDIRAADGCRARARQRSRPGFWWWSAEFGYLEIHGNPSAVRSAASAVLLELGADARDALPPKVLASKIVPSADHLHAFLINRSKRGHMALAGESLFVLEMQPAAYAILATNEAEKSTDIKVRWSPG